MRGSVGWRRIGRLREAAHECTIDAEARFDLRAVRFESVEYLFGQDVVACLDVEGHPNSVSGGRRCLGDPRVAPGGEEPA